MSVKAVSLEYEGRACAQECAAADICCLPPTVIGASNADKLLERTLVFSVAGGSFLTKREAEILRLIVAGQTNKQIAHRLSRSERTVEYHRNRLMRKVGAHNAAELVRQALAAGVM